MAFFEELEVASIEMPWEIEGFEVVGDALHVLGPFGEFMILWPHDLKNLGFA